jgi:hypothetical protein
VRRREQPVARQHGLPCVRGQRRPGRGVPRLFSGSLSAGAAGPGAAAGHGGIK